MKTVFCRRTYLEDLLDLNSGFLIVILKAHRISRKCIEIMRFSYYIAFNLLYVERYANILNTDDILGWLLTEDTRFVWFPI